MPSGFTNIHYHRDREGILESEEIQAKAGVPDSEMPVFSNNESAARYYLSRALANAGLEAAEATRPEVAADFQLEAEREQPLMGTRAVRFQQTRASVPVFGATTAVKLDAPRELVSLDIERAEGLEGVSPMPALGPAEALKRIAKFSAVGAEALANVHPPSLTFFHDDEQDAWHLAYLFKQVPAAPAELRAGVATGEHRRYGLGPSLRGRYPELNYLVDAHDGAILFYYSAHPTLDKPTKCRGTDEDDLAQEFFGRMSPGGFAMSDPARAIRTFDLKFNDVEKTAQLEEPIQNPNANWLATNKAAVSAHVNATRVYDFYKGVLQRDSIDDRGMELVSVVNCTVPAEEKPPVWTNAMWWRSRIWYGQIRDSSGELRSFSRYLDIIAHELTHGVTETTANLVYRNQPGALNESFSDIFGVIICNWYAVGADSDPRTWKWEIGAGLGKGGLPLRDMRDPERTGHPAHMNDYLNLPVYKDYGGVHSNCSIHNKAAYNLLTAADDAGHLIFTPHDVAILYYYTLTDLGQLADFRKTLQVLISEAMTYYAGDEAERDHKVEVIKNAYAKVGIELVDS